MAKSVKIYSTPSCVYCKQAKAFMNEHNVPYQEFNVAVDMTAQKEMIEKSQQMGVPVIDVDGDIYIGFDRRALGEALGISSQ
jgi:glutaredoxin 3